MPKNVGLRQKIVKKYSELYYEYRRFYPERKDYTYQQLKQNIAEVITIADRFVDSSEIKTATFIPWLDNNWKQLYYLTFASAQVSRF